MILPIIYIDTCAFYPPQKGEKDAMDKLWELDKKKIISLEVCQASDEEMLHAPDFIRNKFKNKLDSRIYSADDFNTLKEQQWLSKMNMLLFPVKTELNVSEKNDIRNLVCAYKYKCNIFVTVDKKHILSKASEIRKEFCLNVVSPAQCILLVRNLIEKST